MESMGNVSGRSAARTMLIVFFCVLANAVGKYIAVAWALPLWMDAFGTGLAAYVLGPISGAIVGLTSSVVYAFWDSRQLIYGITSIFIGLSVGMAGREKHFESIFGATSVAGVVAMGSALTSTILNLLFFDGNTGNIWGDGVRNFLMEKGFPDMLSAAVGELYLDFLDKLVTILALYTLIQAVRAFRSRRNGKRVAAMLTLLLAGALLSSANAENTLDPYFIQRVYDVNSGLPCVRANDIAQTGNGMLWIGTDAGLYLYNGSRFRSMNEDEYSAVRNVNCLYVDQEGRLWIGTDDSGVLLAINEKVANTLDSASGLPSDSVRCIVQSSDGDYYVGTTGSMAVIRITIGIAIADTIPEIRNAQCVSADQSGHVAATTSEGQLFILKDHAPLCEIAPPQGSTAFTACTFDEAGVLCAGTSDGRVIALRLEDGLEAGRSVLCEGAGKINQIVFQDDQVWVLADDGIWVRKAGAFQRIDTGDFVSSIRRMTTDYQGNLWFASPRQGLLQLSETIFPNLNVRYGLAAETVHATAVRDGILYIGTGRGLAAVELAAGRQIQDALTKRLSGTPVSCMITDHADNLWICGGVKGPLCVSPDGRMRSYETRGINAATVCHALPDGSVAVAGSDRLVLIRDGRQTVIPCAEALGGKRILSIYGLPDGRILLGTDGNGMLVLRDGAVDGHLTKDEGLTSDTVLRIVPDGNSGRLFLVTGNGLCWMEGDTIHPVPGFPYSDNYDIVLDDDGEVFVLGSSGIYVAQKAALLSDGDFDYTLLDFRTGLRGPLTEGAWNALTPDKNLYLCTEQGALLLNLDTYQSRKRSYRLMVSAIKLDGRTVDIERGSGLTIGREINSIEFIPEIVNYSREEPKVSYYLEGLESEYKTLAQSDLSGVVYTNLTSGEYTFHLAIIDEDTGRIWEESTYGFIKEKSIHDNSWFMVYMLIVGGLFVGWITWCLTRLAAQRTIEFQQERLALALKQVQMGNETILAIAKTVDAKDSLTSKHSQRVSEYSTMIARRAGFTEDEQENLRKAALLHDIGKIGIPDSILNKPARLTDREYAIMKTHVTRGSEILKDFTLIDHVVEGARFHHERYDGRGYPDGLKGKDIPLYGRIIAIADAFDAMTANRVYRKRLDFDFVMSELHKGRGTQFDPELLDLFLQVLDSGEIDVNALYTESTEEPGEEMADE